MRTWHRSGACSFLLIALSILAMSASRSGAAVPDSPAAISHDQTLQRRVSIMATSIPLRYVLKRMASVTGVPLSVSGRAGDERAILLVREAPIHEVMTSIAELYRLQWSRTGTGDTHGYALARSAASAREEASARERSFRTGYAEWMRREAEARDPAVTEKAIVFRLPGRPPVVLDAGIKECQARLLPLVRPELPRLLQEGVLSQPLGQWPEAERDGAIQAVQAWLDNQAAAHHQLYRIAVEESPQAQEPPARIRQAPVAPRAAQSSLKIELDTKPQLSLSVGIVTPDGQLHSLSHSRALIPEDTGVDLYAGRALRPILPGMPPAAVLPESDPLARRLPAAGSPEASDVTLVDRLQQLATATGLSIYADDYSGTWLLSNRRPTSGYDGAASLAAAEALDALCRQDAPAKSAHSFWWRKDAAVFLRSRSWLWESEAVLPADLPQSLATSIRQTDRPGAPNLNRLAALSGLQVASLQSRPGGLAAWKYYLQAPTALTLASRLRLARGGLAWEDLTEPERTVLFRLIPSVRSEPYTYSTRLESWLQKAEAGHETAVITLDGRCGREKISTGLRFPVPNLREGLTITLR